MKNINHWGSETSSKAIIYVHGGGYVMGDGNDLPQPFIDLFLRYDYQLFAINYPLAPQMKQREIVESIAQTINQITDTYSLDSYLLFGRSSGGNAILSLDPRQLNQQPQSLLLFYSYASLDLDWIHQPIRDIDLPVNKDLVERIGHETHITNQRDIQHFYTYYYSLRKLDRWQEAVEFQEAPIQWNPNIPTFVIHSIFDPDVPYHCSKTIRNHFKDNHFLSFTEKKHAIDHMPVIIERVISELESFLNKVKETVYDYN